MNESAFPFYLYFLNNTQWPFSTFLQTIINWEPVAYLPSSPPFSFLPDLFLFGFVNLSVAAPLATPSCEGLLLQDNAVSAEIRALLSSYYNDRWSNKNLGLKLYVLGHQLSRISFTRFLVSRCGCNHALYLGLDLSHSVQDNIRTLQSLKIIACFSCSTSFMCCNFQKHQLSRSLWISIKSKKLLCNLAWFQQSLSACPLNT